MDSTAGPAGSPANRYQISLYEEVGGSCVQTATAVCIARCKLVPHYAARHTVTIGKCFRPA